MASRLAFLALFTGLFMTVWTTDRPSSPAKATAGATPVRSAVRVVLNQKLHEEKIEQLYAQAGRNSIYSLVAADRKRLASTFLQPEIPLPAGITVGDYQAVNTQGEVVSIHLSEGDLFNERLVYSAKIQDVYSVTTKSGQWYFIRQENSASHSDSIAASKNPKFQVTQFLQLTAEVLDSVSQHWLAGDLPAIKKEFSQSLRPMKSQLMRIGTAQTERKLQ